MNRKELREFLTATMSMTEVYQPVVIKHLLLNGGSCSKEQLATRLADNDESVQEYYRRILMRWPKITLTKHDVVSYDRTTQQFKLNLEPSDSEFDDLVAICDAKIASWISSKRRSKSGSEVTSSLRYEVLKEARGKCQLCGVPSELTPIDVDHIVPRSKANKYGKVIIEGKPVDVHSKDNLQALCFRCNRAKRDGDDTDWRRRKKLIRDEVPSQIKSEGRLPIVKKLTGSALTVALRDKLVEEVGEYLSSGKIEELADILEVIRALAKSTGHSEYEVEEVRENKVRDRGGFEEGWFYEGDG